MENENKSIAERGGGFVTYVVGGDRIRIYICHCGNEIEVIEKKDLLQRPGLPINWWFNDKKMFCEKHEDLKKKELRLGGVSIIDMLENMEKQINFIKNTLNQKWNDGKGET